MRPYFQNSTVCIKSFYCIPLGQFFFDDYTTDMRHRDRWMIKHTWEYHNRVVNEHVNQIPHLTAVLMVTDKVCWV